MDMEKNGDISWTWTEHITNEEVLAGIAEERTAIRTILKRQRTWIVHMLRGDLLLRTVIEMKMGRKKTRGSPSRTMLERMMADHGYGKLKEEALLQEEWRRRTLQHA